jgi:hypothetical protein
MKASAFGFGLTTLVVGLAGLVVSVGAQDATSSTKRDVIRIGTYDTRAIAVAWAASKHNDLADKFKELEAAKKANDSKRITELEAWGRSHQQVLHFQGFGRVPVDDLLRPVQASMQELLAAKNLSAITMQCDLVAERVEVVDVTMDLVRLFEPAEKTLKWVEQLRDKEPLSLAELSKLEPGK